MTPGPPQPADFKPPPPPLCVLCRMRDCRQPNDAKCHERQTWLHEQRLRTKGLLDRWQADLGV